MQDIPHPQRGNEAKRGRSGLRYTQFKTSYCPALSKFGRGFLLSPHRQEAGQDRIVCGSVWVHYMTQSQPGCPPPNGRDFKSPGPGRIASVLSCSGAWPRIGPAAKGFWRGLVGPGRKETPVLAGNPPLNPSVPRKRINRGSGVSFQAFPFCRVFVCSGPRTVFLGSPPGFPGSRRVQAAIQITDPGNGEAGRLWSPGFIVGPCSRGPPKLKPSCHKSRCRDQECSGSCSVANLECLVDLK